LPQKEKKKMRPLIFYLTLGVLLFLQADSIGQGGKTNDLYFKASYRPGLVLPEYSFVNYLVDDYVHSFSISVSKQTTGQNEWSQVYNYPEYGLALQYATLGNTEIFGRELSLYPYFTIHFLEAGKFSLQNQIGLGIGYVNKKFDTDKNLYNVAIGSNFNLHFNFELNAQYQVQRKLFLYTGVCLDHLSNGNLGEPNLGINYMAFNIGVRYLPGEKSERTRYELPKHLPRTQSDFVLSIGTKHARALQSKSYFISSLSYELKRSVCRIFSPGIGADIFYDGSTSVEVAAFSDHEYKNIDAFKTGLHIAEEFVYDKFSLSLEEGIYVILTDKAFDNKTYGRFIVRQQVSDRFFIQMAMKSHVVVLDFLEFGVGYTMK
jgi:hypothetical protein